MAGLLSSVAAPAIAKAAAIATPATFSGTGAITLGAASAFSRAFGAFGSAYFITDAEGPVEVGLGAFAADGTALERTHVEWTRPVS